MSQEILRWFASISAMGAGVALAARVRPRLMGWVLVMLPFASAAWVIVG